MKTLTSILLLSVVLFSCQEVNDDVTETKKEVSSTMETPFIHHVYFYLKNPENEADHVKLKEGLKFLATVPSIYKSYIGVPADTDREVIDNTYAFSWLCFFENAADQAAYQEDPIHLQFIEDYADLWETVKVYDSVAE